MQLQLTSTDTDAIYFFTIAAHLAMHATMKCKPIQVYVQIIEVSYSRGHFLEGFFNNLYI